MWRGFADFGHGEAARLVGIAFLSFAASDLFDFLSRLTMDGLRIPKQALSWMDNFTE